MCRYFSLIDHWYAVGIFCLDMVSAVKCRSLYDYAMGDASRRLDGAFIHASCALAAAMVELGDQLCTDVSRRSKRLMFALMRGTSRSFYGFSQVVISRRRRAHCRRGIYYSGSRLNAVYLSITKNRVSSYEKPNNFCLL